MWPGRSAVGSGAGGRASSYCRGQLSWVSACDSQQGMFSSLSKKKKKGGWKYYEAVDFYQRDTI